MTPTPSMRQALEWTAAALQSLSNGTLSENSTFTISGVKRSIREILEEADTAFGARSEQPRKEIAGWRIRHRSEPGMIGHYPWSYTDRIRGGRMDAQYEYEPLYTALQQRAPQSEAVPGAVWHEGSVSLIKRGSEDDYCARHPGATRIFHAPQHPTQPENIRTGQPYDDPAFEQLAREHDVWGRASSALCAVFWMAGKDAQGQDAKDAARYRGFRTAMIAGDGAWLQAIEDSLTAMGLDHDDDPTAEQVDAAFDAAMQQQESSNG